MSTTNEKIVADCPSCNGQRHAYVRAQHDFYEQALDDTSIVARILECGGCQTIFFRKDTWSTAWATGEGDDTDIKYWPSNNLQKSPITRDPPFWLSNSFIYWPQPDASLINLLNETYSATNNGLLVLAAIGVRTSIDRSAELLGVDAGKPFVQKLEALVELGKISLDDQRILGVLIDAGSAAAHRGWKPAPAELNTMLEVMEAFIKRQFISDDIKKLQQAVPPRQPLKEKSA